MATRNWLAIVRGARSVAWHAAGRRTLASSASRARERPGTPAAAPPIDAVVRGADDLDRAELLSPGSHALDRALVEQLMHSDEQEAAARDWLHEMQSGKLDPHYERYLDWEAEQLARVRAARAGGGKAGAAGAAGTAQGDGTGGAGGAKVDEASADADAEFDSDAHAPADGPDEVADGAGGAQDDGRLVPRMPIEFMNDFPGELRRDELNSPADRALLEQTAAVHAAEGMPFELSEISHRQKERLFELHTADPVTYSATRLGAMLGFPPDHVSAIFFLQAAQRERDMAAEPKDGDAEADAQAKSKARQLHAELAELASEYDRQFDTFLNLEQVRDGLRHGARALRNPSLGSDAVAQRVYARQRLDASSVAQLESADRSEEALERFVEFEERAYHFGRTSPAALEAAVARVSGHATAAAALAIVSGGGRAGALAEPDGAVGDAQPAYRSAVLAQLKQLDGYADAEQRAYEAISRVHAAASGDGVSDDAAREAATLAALADERASASASATERAPFEQPGLSEAEVVEMLAVDAARFRLPELLDPAIAQLLFDAQFFAPEFDLPAPELERLHRAERASAPADALDASAAGAGKFVMLPASVAPFTTLVPLGRATPAFRYVADLGPDANYLTQRERETIARRVARASDGACVGFDPQAAARRIARNRQRRFQAKRPGEFFIVDTTPKEGALRGSRSKPSGRVVVHERGTARPGTEEEHEEARGYLGHGPRRPHRLTFG